MIAASKKFTGKPAVMYFLIVILFVGQLALYPSVSLAAGNLAQGRVLLQAHSVMYMYQLMLMTVTQERIGKVQATHSLNGLKWT